MNKENDYENPSPPLPLKLGDISRDEPVFALLLKNCTNTKFESHDSSANNNNKGGGDYNFNRRDETPKGGGG